MQKSLAAFIRTGNPNNSALGATWTAWSPSAPHKMDFDATNDQATIAAE
jgi:para-nitrobenzyl esterase